MLLIPCPWCGPRDETEFECGGEAHIARPVDSDAMSDAEWGDYLFMRTNPKGTQRERWFHVHGCRRWFNVARDSVSHDILAVYEIGQKPEIAKTAPKKTRASKTTSTKTSRGPA